MIRVFDMRCDRTKLTHNDNVSVDHDSDRSSLDLRVWAPCRYQSWVASLLRASSCNARFDNKACGLCVMGTASTTSLLAKLSIFDTQFEFRHTIWASVRDI